MFEGKILDLFSGIGGFSLGLERAGFETVAFCEIEKYPRSKLKKHWPDVPIYEDVRKLDGKQYRGSVDLICGGFPCQPFSVAGKQRGKEDDRHLWPEMLRLIKEIRPTWVIGENVAGFITMALDDVLSNLEAEGYTCQPFVIPACAVGGIHRRDRVWIVAHTDRQGESGESIDDYEGKRVYSDTTSIRQSTSRTHGESSDKTESGNGETGNAFNATNGLIRATTQPPVRHRDDGLSDNVARLKALGNAVVPQIVELLGRGIMEVENR